MNLTSIILLLVRYFLTFNWLCFVHVYVFYHLFLWFTLSYSVYDFSCLRKHVHLSRIFYNKLTYLLTILPYLVQLRSLEYGVVRHWSDQKLGVFHKYSLGSDTVTPIGLYTRLCHAFLVPVCLVCTEIMKQVRVYLQIIVEIKAKLKSKINK